MKLKLNFTHFALLCIIFQAVACSTTAPPEPTDFACITQQITPIQSIHPNQYKAENYSFLQKEIGSARIAMLGEISHGDGASFEAKISMIKYLHQEMGFDVLVFESGMWDCMLAWERILQGENIDTAFMRAVFPVWSESNQVQALLNYIDSCAHTNRPLQLAGFDMQISGNESMKDRSEIIRTQILKTDSTLNPENYSHLFELFKNSKKYFKRIDKNKTDSSMHLKIRADLQKLIRHLDSVPAQDMKSQYFRKYMHNLNDLLYFYWYLDYRNMDPKIANIRDARMAENLIWQEEHIFKNRKLIVWGATSHLLHNRQLLKYPDDMIPMGQYIYNRYADTCKLIAFTCYTGTMGSIAQNNTYPISQSRLNGIETALSQTKHPYAYISLQNLPAECNNTVFSARFLGTANWFAPWQRMMHGFVFIHTMTPNTKKQ